MRTAPKLRTTREVFDSTNIEDIKEHYEAMIDQLYEHELLLSQIAMPEDIAKLILNTIRTSEFMGQTEIKLATLYKEQGQTNEEILENLYEYKQKKYKENSDGRLARTTVDEGSDDKHLDSGTGE